MEIVKTGDLMAKLPAEFKIYVEALHSPYLKDIKKTEAIKSIYGAIVMAVEYTGSKIKTEDSGATMFIAENLYLEICLKLQMARIAEVHNALKFGSLGEYGEFYGINVANCFKWVKSYLNSQKRADSVKEYHRLIDERDGVKRADKPLTDFFKSPEVKAGVYEMFEKFKKGEPLPVYSRVYYDFICEAKGVKSLIKDDQVRLSIRSRAKQEYEAELKGKKYHLKEPDLFETLLNHFYQSKSYDSIAKKLALFEYFKQCQAENIPPL